MDNTLEKNLAAALEEDMAARGTGYTEALEEDMAAYEAAQSRPLSAAEQIAASAEEHCQMIAVNKAQLAALHERTEREIADLWDERRRIEQDYERRVAIVDAQIEAMRASERRQAEAGERHIAAARAALKELLA